MSQQNAGQGADRAVIAAALVISLLSFFLYLYTLAPGLTWAHFGADGGELIAAAMVNGVPHPPGYPLYMILLRGWLFIGQMIAPAAELAWLGNLLSAFCAAASAGITTVVGAHLLLHPLSFDGSNVGPETVERTAPKSPHIWLWAALIGLAWATAPLLWKQAIITEVYALHVLLISLLGWSLIVARGRLTFITLSIGFGLAHHLTFVLLLPGVLYWLWHTEQVKARDKARQSDSDPAAAHSPLADLFWAGCKLIPGVVLGLLIYIRIPLVAAAGPPINWGYPDNWDGFWWLTSAEAYRGYLFGVPASSIFDRISAWAYNLTSQFTAVGLAFALLGLSKWDRETPALRNLGLLWLLPISVYAISYYTKDSTIYLLPCMWLLAIWLGIGLSEGVAWLQSAGQDGEPSVALVAKISAALDKFPKVALPAAAICLVIVLALIRLPEISLRNDTEASTFLGGAEAVLPPDSIIISSADNETFSLWYGVWGSGQLVNADGSADGQQGPYLINGALLQFPWYQRLVREQYPELPGAGEQIRLLIQKNRSSRPIFFSEADQGFVRSDSLEPVGPLWRYRFE